MQGRQQGLRLRNRERRPRRRHEVWHRRQDDRRRDHLRRHSDIDLLGLDGLRGRAFVDALTGEARIVGVAGAASHGWRAGELGCGRRHRLRAGLVRWRCGRRRRAIGLGRGRAVVAQKSQARGRRRVRWLRGLGRKAARGRDHVACRGCRNACHGGNDKPGENNSPDQLMLRRHWDANPFRHCALPCRIMQTFLRVER